MNYININPAAMHVLEAGAWLPMGLRVMTPRLEEDAARRGLLTLCPRGHVFHEIKCDNGWGCAGMNAPGGCLQGCRRDPEAVEVALAEGRFDQFSWDPDQIRANGHNTAGWKRYSTRPTSNYDMCEACFARETAVQAKGRLVACWLYPAASEKDGEFDAAPAEPNVVDISGRNRVPLFIVLPKVLDWSGKPRAPSISECEALLRNLESCRYHESSRDFRDDIHIFLVVSPTENGIEQVCHQVNGVTQYVLAQMLRDADNPQISFDAMRSRPPLDVVHQRDFEQYFEPLGMVSLLNGAVFTTVPRCRATCLGPHAPPQPPEACLGIEILQFPGPRGSSEQNTVLLGVSALRALGGGLGPQAEPLL